MNKEQEYVDSYVQRMTDIRPTARIYLAIIFASIVALYVSACDNAYRPVDRWDPELRAELAKQDSAQKVIDWKATKEYAALSKTLGFAISENIKAHPHDWIAVTDTTGPETSAHYKLKVSNPYCGIELLCVYYGSPMTIWPTLIKPINADCFSMKEREILQATIGQCILIPNQKAKVKEQELVIQALKIQLEGYSEGQRIKLRALQGTQQEKVNQLIKSNHK